MSFHSQCHFLTPSGELSTIWERPKVETLAEAERQVRAAIAKARRLGGRNLKVDVYDDLLCRAIYVGRVKP